MANPSGKELNNLLPPAKRHFASKVDQRTVTKRLNSVIDNSVDIVADVSAIRIGDVEIVEGNFHLKNGRVYGQHHGRLFPISGDGIYQLNRGAFKALGILNQFGNTDRTHSILQKMGIQRETLNEAMKVFVSINQ